ncbi:hypothetical protein FRC03_000293 [Tulasnella sp. 419]|nr:hypothetical protein FRC03_000293 [Tulasnella sp. 419]
MPLLGLDMDDILNTPIFPLIHRIKQDAIQNIDTALSWDQLRAPDVNFSIIKPLVTKYARLENKGIICAFLVVRAHFLSSAEDDLAFSPLMNCRAAFCELMAMKLLREFASRRIELVIVCTTPWNILQGASEQTIKDIKIAVGERESEDPVSALEVAIMTESKHFLSSPLVQDVVNDIWSGNVQFLSPSTSRSLVADNYKRRHIATYYDPKTAPFLDHYRLRVPKYRAVIEMFNFSILLFLFVLCLANKDFSYAGPTEIVFGIFAFGFVLHEFAASQVCRASVIRQVAFLMYLSPGTRMDEYV